MCVAVPQGNKLSQLGIKFKTFSFHHWSVSLEVCLLLLLFFLPSLLYLVVKVLFWATKVCSAWRILLPTAWRIDESEWNVAEHKFSILQLVHHRIIYVFFSTLVFCVSKFHCYIFKLTVKNIVEYGMTKVWDLKEYSKRFNAGFSANFVIKEDN